MNYKKLISVTAAFCIACSSLPLVQRYTASPAVFAEESSEVSGTIELVNIGSSKQITFTNASEAPTWYSDNTNVATVSSDGTVTAVGEGTAYVYAVFSTQLLKFAVVVTVEKPQTEVQLGNFTLSNEHPSATVNLSGVSAEGAVWSSSDTTVATVDGSGKVTAVGTGSCIITALINGITYVVNVTSTYIPDEADSIVKLGTVTLTNEKNAYQINLSNFPEGAQISWSSTDEAVAKVDSNGLIIAAGTGSCQIIAETNGIRYIADIISEYIPPEVPEEVVLGDLELSDQRPSSTITLSGVAEGTIIEWSSTDESIAKVDNNGTVTAVSSGSCKIVALINGIRYVMNVTSTYSPDEEITISGGDFEIHGIGNKLQLSVENTDEAPEWMSMNVNVATVDENGLVTAVSEGEAVILARFSNKVIQITVTVKDDFLYGDANCNGIVEVADAVLILQSIADPGNTKYQLSELGAVQADCCKPSSGVDTEDALAIQKLKADIIPALPAL